MTCFPGNQVDWIAAILLSQFGFHLIGCLKREWGTRWNLDISTTLFFPLLLENCKHTSDWFGLFWLFRCLRKSVTNKERSSRISLYSIWPVPFARGSTLSIAVSFLSVLFPNQPALLLFISPRSNRVCSKPHQTATERVCGSTVVARSPFCTAVIIRLSGGHRQLMLHVRVCAESQSQRFLDITLIEAKWISQCGRVGEQLKVNHPYSVFQMVPIIATMLLFDCAFCNPSCYLINLSIHPLPAGHRQSHLPMLLFCINSYISVEKTLVIIINILIYSYIHVFKACYSKIL